jgi:hypothetical protein
MCAKALSRRGADPTLAIPAQTADRLRQELDNVKQLRAEVILRSSRGTSDERQLKRSAEAKATSSLKRAEQVAQLEQKVKSKLKVLKQVSMPIRGRPDSIQADGRGVVQSGFRGRVHATTSRAGSKHDGKLCSSAIAIQSERSTDRLTILLKCEPDQLVMLPLGFPHFPGQPTTMVSLSRPQKARRTISSDPIDFERRPSLLAFAPATVFGPSCLPYCCRTLVARWFPLIRRTASPAPSEKSRVDSP